MKRTILTALLLIIMIPCLNAQKKEIAQARAFIKSGKDFDKAELLMTDLLKDSANRGNIKIYQMLTEAVRKQYEAGNEQLYLKQKYDTTALFLLVRKMFLVHEQLDSVDALPDNNGIVKTKYRKKNAEYLMPYRLNLFNGGLYFLRKQQYKTAYDFMDSYIETAQHPLLNGYIMNNRDTVRETRAAYWTLFCGYKMDNPSLALKYADTAMADTARLDYIYQYLAEMHLAKNDTAKYIDNLKKGFDRFTDKHYFFTRLLDYYNGHNMSDSAMNVVNTALEHDDSCVLFIYAKSNLLLNAGLYEECATLCDRLIALNDTVAEAYYNAGVAYINIAFELDRKTRTTAKGRAKLKEYYKKALPYMEKYRAMRPDEKDKWAAALYNIYLELNMGKEFEEIDRLLR